MRHSHTQGPRLRTASLHRVVAAALALPLALGALAASALPATAGESLDRVSHAGTASVGIASTATFFCQDTPEKPLVQARWYTSEDQGGAVDSTTPGSGEVTFARDVVYSLPGFVMIGLTCDYSPLADETDATFSNILVNVGYQTLATTTSVAFHPERVEPGNPISVSATITTADGPVTDGVVQLSMDGVDVGAPLTLDSSGVATASIDNPGWGTHEVEAAYWGTDTLEASTSAGTVWVKATTTVSTVVPDQVRAPHTELRATAETVSGLAAPSGTVTFRYSEGAVLGTAPLVDGQAVLALPTLAPGVYDDVFAVYSGDDVYGEASSGRRTMVVNPALPTHPVKGTSAVTVEVPRTVTGTQVPVKVTVTPGTTSTSASVAGVATPSGSVDVTLGTGGPRQTVTLVDGVATLVFGGVAPGTYEVEALYSGDAHFTAAAGTAPTTVVAPVVTPPVAPDLSGSTSALPAGGTITLIARGFLPGETVSFSLHSDPVFLGTAVADANGVAALVVAIPAGAPAGEHHVRAIGATSLRTAEIPLTVTAAAPVVTAPIVTVPVVVPVAAAPVATAPAPAAAVPLASTGAELGSTALLVSVLLGSGALLLAGRRRFAPSAR